MNRGDDVRQAVFTAIYAAIETINKGRTDDSRLDKAPETVLLGEEGQLDSLALVNLIVGVEENIEASLGSEIALADERAMEQEVSPFGTVSSLADYITTLLTEAMDV